MLDKNIKLFIVTSALKFKTMILPIIPCNKYVCVCVIVCDCSVRWLVVWSLFSNCSQNHIHLHSLLDKLTYLYYFR